MYSGEGILPDRIPVLIKRALLPAAALFLLSLMGLSAQTPQVSTPEVSPSPAADQADTAQTVPVVPADVLSPPDERTPVAAVPAKGGTSEILNVFNPVLLGAMDKIPGYRPVPVDMENLPSDVPPGGFPPYVCPSPSMTGDSPYAMTGEVFFDDELESWHLRLYLWRMEGTRLIYTDELVAGNGEECAEYLPGLLQWLFSWLDEPAAAEEAAAEEPLAEAEEPVEEEAEERDTPPPLSPAEKWLYLGVRAGSSLRFYTRPPTNLFYERGTFDFYNISAALQVSVQIIRLLAVQAELIWTTDYASFNAIRQSPFAVRADPFKSQSLMLPVSAKFTYRKDSLMTALFAGVYFILPLGSMENTTLGGIFSYGLTMPLGYTAGLNIGMKAGPGHLFLDIRWAADLADTMKPDRTIIYKRSMVSLSVGYEFGLINKNKN